MNFQKAKRWILGLMAILATAGALTYAWSYWPIHADPDEADPAVSVANRIAASGASYSEGYVNSRGNQIHYVVAGKGEPMVFLHGFPSYWFTMFGLMDQFAANHQVIAIDGLGVGHSDAPTSVDAYELSGLVADVQAVIDHLELGTVHMVGHDWGAAVAAATAQSDPSKVKTLTMIGALPQNIILQRLDTDPAHRETFAYMSTFKSANPPLIKILGADDGIWTDIYQPLHKAGLMPDEQAARLRADLGDARRTDRFINWYRANFPGFEEIEDGDFWPSRDARITVPSLFIYGRKDRVVTEAMVGDLAKSADGLEILAFDEVEHRPHFEKRADVVSAIKKLIAAPEEKSIQSGDIRSGWHWH